MNKKITSKQILIVTVILLLITIFLGGGGHGTYIPAKLFYPFSMILIQLFGMIGGMTGVTIGGILGGILTLGQIPFYGWILIKKPKWKGYLIAIHILAILICFGINDSNFA